MADRLVRVRPLAFLALPADMLSAMRMTFGLVVEIAFIASRVLVGRFAGLVLGAARAGLVENAGKRRSISTIGILAEFAAQFALGMFQDPAA
jgi:hypothetical protein